MIRNRWVGWRGRGEFGFFKVSLWLEGWVKEGVVSGRFWERDCKIKGW